MVHIHIWDQYQHNHLIFDRISRVFWAMAIVLFDAAYAERRLHILYPMGRWRIAFENLAFRIVVVVACSDYIFSQDCGIWRPVRCISLLSRSS
jgi:hypothetical protein